MEVAGNDGGVWAVCVDGRQHDYDYGARSDDGWWTVSHVSEHKRGFGLPAFCSCLNVYPVGHDIVRVQTVPSSAVILG